MIRIIVQLVPHGIGEPKELGRLIIANDGKQGNGEVGDYNVRLGRKGQDSDLKIYSKPLREGRVVGHRRLALSVWSLVSKALKSVGY